MIFYIGAFVGLIALGAIGFLLWLARAEAVVPAPKVDPASAPTDTDPTAEAADPFQRILARAHSTAGGAWFAIFLFALLSPEPVTQGYKGTILFCLLVAGLAVAFYRIIPAPDAVSGGFYLLNIGVLFIAFTDLISFRVPSPLVLLAPVVGGVAYLSIVRAYALPGRLYTPGYHPTGIVYVLLLSLLTWQALELATQRPTPWSYAVLGGVLLYWITLALYHLTRRPPVQQVPLLPTQTAHLTRQRFILPAAGLLAAHWCLALSVWTL